MATKLAFFVYFITFFFLCSSEPISFAHINIWCEKMPYPIACHHYVAIRHHDKSKTLSQNQFLNMTVAATVDSAISVFDKTVRVEDMTLPGKEKELRKSCVFYCYQTVYILNETLDRPGKPYLDPLDKKWHLNEATNFTGSCIQGFIDNNITSVFLLYSNEMLQLIVNGLTLLPWK